MLKSKIEMKKLNQDISTARTLLRKYVESDREKFAEISIDKEVNHYIGGRCEIREDAYKLFDKCFEVYNGVFPDRHFEIWAIESNSELIGHFELKQTKDTNHKELEAVYLLDKLSWGQGLMSEILREINEYAYHQNKQLIATINPENEKTIRVLEKIGMERKEYINEGKDRTLKIWIKKFLIT